MTAKTWFFGGISVGVILLGGCMMMGGMDGMHGMEPDAPAPAAPAAIEEIRTDDLHAALEVPAAAPGEEVVLTVRLRETETAEPVSGADVTFTVVPAEQGEDAQLQAGEAVEAGAYQVSHTFKETGSHEVTAEIRTGEGGTGSESVALTATHSVAPAASDGSERRSLLLPLAIIAGVGMAVVMVLMMSGGMMF